MSSDMQKIFEKLTEEEKEVVENFIGESLYPPLIKCEEYEYDPYEEVTVVEGVDITHQNDPNYVIHQGEFGREYANILAEYRIESGTFNQKWNQLKWDLIQQSELDDVDLNDDEQRINFNKMMREEQKKFRKEYEEKQAERRQKLIKFRQEWEAKKKS